VGGTFGADELLGDFLVEAGELLCDVDLKLVELEREPGDGALLNAIFRGFHTIKGGAGFLEVAALVALCHRTETLFDRLRGGALALDAALMDLILAATGEVRRMFGEMESGVTPSSAPQALLDALEAAAAGTVATATPVTASAAKTPTAAMPASAPPATVPAATPNGGVTATATAHAGPDWAALLRAIAPQAAETVAAPASTGAAAAGVPSTPVARTTAPMATDAAATSAPVGAATPATDAIATSPVPSAPRAVPASPAAPAGAKPRGGAMPTAAKETTLRVDTERFDQILNLSGEIGLARNRLVCLRERLGESTDPAGTLAHAVDQLDGLVSDLQRVVMKARMQPVGRVFQKFVRLARDLARNLGKDVELVLEGEETEVDKTILDELNDPLVHLVRNAVDHGVESREDRAAAGKTGRSVVRLSAMQAGDHIVVAIADDGRGMRPEVIRAKAVEKGLLGADEAALLDDRQALALIFLPGFSTKAAVTDVSGRGVGMDVVKTQVERLKGRVEIDSQPGRGTRIAIRLPLTLAILPVLVAALDAQPFAIPLGAVREIVALDRGGVRSVAGRPHILLRGEVLPVASLRTLLGRAVEAPPPVGVVLALLDETIVLGVDSVLGQDEVMIKPVDGLRARGIAGATVSGDGELVLVLELHELLGEALGRR
jgi:two-component system chemotaxis sensor kinase CheA